MRDDILRGHYPPEFHLQEIPLSAELGVSRTPVRTALASLATEGLLDYVAKRGYSVRSFTLEEIEAAHEIRANLEGLACRLAAERGLSTESERELEAILALGDRILAHEALRDEDRGPWSAMNDRFHSRLLACADSRLLSDLVERTYRVPLASSRVIHWYDFEAIKLSHQLHHRIYRYVRDGQGTNAESLMREHILQGVDQIKERLLDVDDSCTVAMVRAG